ncbi:MAG: aminomethyl-transferring glycine dehydrogenase subunit GcvPB [Firmicutes bacterium]|nr:aminomethyl-transferring glycine dehydrogenase subunit GcvPB [Dethiobacter sp.]MBS3888894.1 aminomethyl-transferring glycine dehydrogenase subunit GcvPB [Bacillota bacterium]MBS4055646.1 aminomethyl-transferring glycine dehydrogenase subunit GcvPB [Thermaerobacter sp.]
MRKETKLIFEKSVPGRRGYQLPPLDTPPVDLLTWLPPESLRTKPPGLPEISEVDAVRHFTELSQRNYGVDAGFYPLGSCTMKYNPKINEDVSRLKGFTNSHPYQPQSLSQGILELLYRLDKLLSEITGMARMSLVPAAGAHGELAGIMAIKAFHRHHGQQQRTKFLVSDSAHGTNPATAAAAGYETVEVKSNEQGGVDLDELRRLMGDDVAGLMLTNPNTLGLFEKDIVEIATIVHAGGGLLYYDGANANAILGITRPGDMGFDVVHLNLHKTFSTPHGGGGPGAGPIGVKERLVPFLPSPTVEYDGAKYSLDFNRPLSVGRIKNFYGHFLVLVRAYAYILSMGPVGLRQVSEMAVLNSNYMLNKLKDRYDVAYDRICMHEFVLSGQKQKAKGCSTLDIAKRLLDYGFHPPTVYFPLIVKEAIMIEPVESEAVETLDSFIDAMLKIADEVENNPELVKSAPSSTVVGRLDEVKAARQPLLRYS